MPTRPINESDIPTIIADAYQASGLFLDLDDPIAEFALSAPVADYDVSGWPQDLKDIVTQAAEHFWRPAEGNQPSRWLPERKVEAVQLFERCPALAMVFQHPPEAVAEAYNIAADR